MRPGLVLFAPPTSEPLALDKVKNALGIFDDDQDDDVLDQIAAVRADLEREMGRALVTQTWDVTWDYWPCGCFEMPKPPLQSVTSFTWTDSAGAPHALTQNTDFVVDTTREAGRILPAAGKVWPSGLLAPVNGIAQRIVCGYGAPSAVPFNLKMAMQLRLGLWYFGRAGREQQQPGTAQEIVQAIDALLKPYRTPLYR